MPKWVRRQKALAAAKDAHERQKPTPPRGKKGGNKPKVVIGSGGVGSTVTRPNNPVVDDFTPTKPPKNPPHGAPTGGGKKPPTGGGKKPPTGGGKKPPTGGTKPTPTPGIGFSPKEMAKTLTNLGYDAEIAAINQQIARNQGNMQEALKDIQGWASQIESQRATGAADTKAMWEQSIADAQAADANIANLFGGAAGAEAGAYANVGEDLLSAVAGSDQAFDARMAPILAAQGQDYARRARGEFNQNADEMRQGLMGLLKEKGQAYQKNLLDLMDMAWGRRQDMLQYQTAQQALEQAKQLQGYDVQKAQQEVAAGKLGLKQGQLDLKAQQVALKKSRVELQRLQQQEAQGGLNWADPSTATAVGRGAMSGALMENGSLLINPKIAWQNAMTALSTLPGGASSQAVQAAWAHFVIALRTSHAHRKWGQYYLNKQGELVYDPTKKFKKK